MQIALSPAILNRVLKPARYTGQEWNSIKKDPASVTVSYALAMPDVYEVGMSNLGLKILYDIINRREDAAAERVYAPWPDMEEQLRQRDIPLYALESFRPVGEFDVFGFSLQYELSFSNVLNMLDLARIPLKTTDRLPEHPFIVGGGPCVFNAEPVADFFDFFIIGEGEEVMNDVTDCLAAWKQAGKPGGREGFLRRAAKLDGVYVPQFYRIDYHADNTIAAVTPLREEARSRVIKRVVADLDKAPFPTQLVMPYLDIVHNRIMLELFRGCTRGCRFCQAGTIYRPVRERRPETLLKLAAELVRNSGYDEISLVSLSTADYSRLSELIHGLQTQLGQDKVSVSLPSLRIDSFSVGLAQQVQAVRKSGLTFAPEAGTQRLRDVINKGVTEENLRDAVTAAFRAGWSSVKLYFMIGLPTETDEDVLGIASLAYRVLDWYREATGRRGAKVSVSVSSFVPKGQTPFQWMAQDSIADMRRKQALLKSSIRDRSISLHWHDPEVSFLEAVFARGDRRLSEVLVQAWKNGARFDGWSEHFKFAVWMDAFAAAGIDPHFYANRRRETDEVLPWDHLYAGVDKRYLLTEYEKGVNLELTADCRRGDCGACGVCGDLGVQVADWGSC
ncbi:MAG: TIGR03960 family B12-binding radical SAM protein [Sporomusaceae bacterium]|nr:TIGR03960 family B12-binding radical SAM protein [Sporomusaceae bacterium]